MMEIEVPRSAATKNFTVSAVMFYFAMLFMLLNCNIGIGVCTAFATVFMFKAISCFLDVQEIDMKIKNEMLKEIKKQTKLLEKNQLIERHDNEH